MGWFKQTIKTGLHSKHHVDWLWGAVLLAAALVLFCTNLGGLPLRDWDEGTVAQVAREIWRGAPDSQSWLFPSVWGKPYINKPLLVHWLMAIAYSLGGVNEWTSRLPGALLTAFSVPLLYWIGRELFHRRTPALFAALIYLTTLPVARHGRLAMLDGAVLCFLLLMLWCVLRSRRDSRFALGIGIAFGLLCLTKGVMLGILFGAIAILFLAWDTPRLLTHPYLWLGILIGSAPVGFWYTIQLQHYGSEFFNKNMLDQSWSRIWNPVENHTGAPWYYLLEILKYGLPWILFLPQGGKLAWENRNLSWAKLALVWSGGYFITVSLMATKLPWYILPIYPALALLEGAQLSILWDSGEHGGVRQTSSAYSPIWIGIFTLLAVLSAIAAFLFTGRLNGLLSGLFIASEPDLMAVFISVAMTMAASAILVARQNPQFLVVLFWGTYLSLLTLMLSNHWVWELAESYPVKPVAQLIQTYTSGSSTIYSADPVNRPSLSFYSDRQIISAASIERLQRIWNKQPQPYLLLDAQARDELDFDPKAVTVLGNAEGWTLITRS